VHPNCLWLYKNNIVSNGLEIRPIRVCIIDDHTLVRAGLRMLIENDPEIVVVGEASNRIQALAAGKASPPDIFLLDLQLGCENGLDFLRELVLTFNLARVLVLTCATDPDVHQRAISSGAMGLVLKDHAPEVLVKAIRRVHSGELWLDPFLMATMVSRRPAKEKNLDVAQMATLTRRESEIVQLVAEGLNNERIARELLISQATVKNHLTSILDKLGVTNKFELAVYALRRGLDKSSKSV